MPPGARTSHWQGHQVALPPSASLDISETEEGTEGLRCAAIPGARGRASSTRPAGPPAGVLLTPLKGAMRPRLSRSAPAPGRARALTHARGGAPASGTRHGACRPLGGAPAAAPGCGGPRRLAPCLRARPPTTAVAAGRRRRRRRWGQSLTSAVKPACSSSSTTVAPPRPPPRRAGVPGTTGLGGGRRHAASHPRA